MYFKNVFCKPTFKKKCENRQVKMMKKSVVHQKRGPLFTKSDGPETKKSSNAFIFFAKCASGYVVAGNTAELRVAAN